MRLWECFLLDTFLSSVHHSLIPLILLFLAFRLIPVLYFFQLFLCVVCQLLNWRLFGILGPFSAINLEAIHFWNESGL